VPLQNRVAPTGEILADPARGLFTGNRGILHEAPGRLGTARWRTKAWIVCRLDFKGVRRAVMTGRTWTELFFLDEAVALAAGHRPCAYCRRAAFNAYAAAWAKGNRWPAARLPRAPEIDRRAHADRVAPRTRRQVTYTAPLGDLPEGTFATLAEAAGRPLLVRADCLLPWRFEGYGAPLRRQDHLAATVLTPRSTVAALAAGYRPVLHHSADSRVPPVGMRPA
jgi:hypothetical protein